MKQTEQWTSKLGFIMAAAGSAIGLGAIWKFPYIAGKSGGGAFFLIFILFTVLIGLPLLIAEFMIGRSTQKQAVGAFKSIAPNTGWHWIGRLGVGTCFILLSFYSVVGGWVLIYLFRGITGQLITPGKNYGTLFTETIGNPAWAIMGHFAFMFITIWVVSKGVQNGIEKASKYMLPALFVLFVALIIRSLTLDDAMKGVKFFLQPDFSKITSESILFAMGQSFFAISIGISIMVTYSSYLNKKESLPKSAITIVGLNLFVSLFAGLAIFPAVFSLGMEPTEGPGLLFIVLPSVFSQIPFGGFFLTVFLALFTFATLTSAFSLLETVVSALANGEQEKRTKLSWLIGFGIFLVGIPSALSFGVWSDITIFGKNIFDAVDFLSSNILMPLGALFISIFVSFKMEKKVLEAEFFVGGNYGKKVFTCWAFLLRFVAPLAIIIVFLNVIGII
ncbi:TPA: sodium-dependent transporter [Bacillus cereus]|uniref:Transporter n=1 Tax=Bacillus thuringiensis subsp. darmstadiensis TaxID=132264 RepID=A0A9X6IX49_BACUD|nr:MULTISPECIES: sodium-dependent transporter [Bacillus cereus group]MCO4219408.1 sodium-dependent transporter [Bacillus sp. 10017]ADH06764.1 Sodium-dependent leucine transporter [Bacillus thuringiensis BMB171]ALZ62121.1 Sodium:neurotransmitter symporter family protein [Bacillus cereus]EKS7862016.1 sodium-dependent transporter [Bacillus cereus]EKS7864761.1 sodium-dependent transporter [Bacillus cereus]